MSTRGQRVYDWWSGHQRLFRALSWVAFAGREGTLRRRALDRLDLSPGDRVVDVGCGPGVNVPALARRVAPGGTVVGLDFSEGMARRARARLATLGVDRVGVHVVRGDAARPPLPPRSVDAAYATLSMTAMADPHRVVRAVRRVLAPGGRFVVLDARPFQSGPLAALNPLVERVSRFATDWRPDADVPGAMAAEFDSVSVDAYHAGAFYVATGRLAGRDGRHGGRAGPSRSSVERR